MDLEYQLRVEADEIIIGFPDGVQNCFKKLDFPQLFFEWQSEARIEMFSLMDQAGATAAKMMPVHLPTMGTISNDVFPINLITRGMGLLLKASILDQVTESFESARKRGTCQVPEKKPKRSPVSRPCFLCGSIEL